MSQPFENRENQNYHIEQNSLFTYSLLSSLFALILIVLMLLLILNVYHIRVKNSHHRSRDNP